MCKRESGAGQNLAGCGVSAGSLSKRVVEPLHSSLPPSLNCLLASAASSAHHATIPKPPQQPKTDLKMGKNNCDRCCWAQKHMWLAKDGAIRPGSHIEAGHVTNHNWSFLTITTPPLQKYTPLTLFKILWAHNRPLCSLCVHYKWFSTEAYWVNINYLAVRHWWLSLGLNLGPEWRLVLTTLSQSWTN